VEAAAAAAALYRTLLADACRLHRHLHRQVAGTYAAATCRLLLGPYRHRLLPDRHRPQSSTIPTSLRHHRATFRRAQPATAPPCMQLPYTSTRPSRSVARASCQATGYASVATTTLRARAYAKSAKSARPTNKSEPASLPSTPTRPIPTRCFAAHRRHATIGALDRLRHQTLVTTPRRLVVLAGRAGTNLVHHPMVVAAVAPKPLHQQHHLMVAVVVVAVTMFRLCHRLHRRRSTVTIAATQSHLASYRQAPLPRQQAAITRVRLAAAAPVDGDQHRTRMSIATVAHHHQHHRHHHQQVALRHPPTTTDMIRARHTIQQTARLCPRQGHPLTTCTTPTSTTAASLRPSTPVLHRPPLIVIIRPTVRRHRQAAATTLMDTMGHHHHRLPVRLLLAPLRPLRPHYRRLQEAVQQLMKGMAQIAILVALSLALN